MLDIDKKYFEAIKNNDVNLLEKLVKQAAEKNGYNIGIVYHGTWQSKFNTFKVPAYFTTDTNYAKNFAGDDQNSNIHSVYLKLENILDLTEYGYEKIGWKKFISILKEKGFKNISITIGEVIQSVQNDYIWFYTRQLTDLAMHFFINNGFDSVKQIENLNGKKNISFVVFRPEAIKSSELITKDGNGNIVLLSKRFNSSSTDIRENKMKTFKQFLMKESEQEDQKQRIEAVKIYNVLYKYVHENILQENYNKKFHQFSNENYHYKLNVTIPELKPLVFTFYGGYHYGGEYVDNEINIFMKDPPNAKDFARQIVNDSKIKDMIIHELIHYLDEKKTKDKFTKGYINPPENLSDEKILTDYFNQPIEYNAYYQSAVSDIENDLTGIRNVKYKQILSSFDEFYKYALTKISKSFTRYIKPDIEKKIIKRLYRYFKERNPENYEKEIYGDVFPR
jgi:hypothetical protein